MFTAELTVKLLQTATVWLNNVRTLNHSSSVKSKQDKQSKIKYKYSDAII